MATKFLEPGGDSTFNFSLWPTANTGSPTIVTDFVHGSHVKSMKFPANSTNGVNNDGVMADAGRRVSGWFYFVALPGSTASFLNISNSGKGTDQIRVRLTSAGVLQLWDNGAQVGINGSTLSTGTWYRLSLSYVITSTTVNDIKLFLNGDEDITIHDATISSTGSAELYIGNNSGSAALDFRASDIYVDDGAGFDDPGNIWVTAKRPNANGSVNNFSTQIGSGDSGYGSGHSPQVNERALSTTNGWSMIGAGSAVTEEYSIESRSTGDIDITGATIKDFMGWVYASSALSETGSIILANVSSNISLTSSNTMFRAFAGSTTYPAGNTDIGIITSTTVTTVSLYEAGIAIAYIPAVATTVSVSDTASISESLGRMADENPNKSDSTTVTDNPSHYSDLVATRESYTLLKTSFISVSDTIGTSESVTVSIAASSVLTISVSDTVAISESTTLLKTSFINVNDSISTAESVSLLITSFINVADTIGSSESLNLLDIDNINVSDSVASTESTTLLIPTLLIGVSDTVNTSESIGRLVTSFILVSDSTGLTENVSVSIAAGATLTINVNDTVGTAESVKAELNSFINVVDTATLTEAITLLVTSFINKSDTVTTAESVNLLIPFLLINVSDSVTTSEAILLSVAGSGIAVLDSIVTSENIQLLIPTLFIGVSDTVTITENIKLTNIENINVSDSLATSENVPTPNISYAINVSDTLNASENVSLLIPTLFINVSDTVGTSESVSVSTGAQSTLSINVSDSASLSESVQLLETSFINVSDSTSLSESVSLSNIINLAVSDSTYPRDEVGQNLIPNPGFEFAPTFVAPTTASGRWIDGTASGSTTNDIYSWGTLGITSAGSAQFDNTVSHSGSSSLKLSLPTTGDIADISNVSINVPVQVLTYGFPMVGSTSYTLTWWLKTSVTSGDSNDGAYIVLTERTATGTTNLSNTSTKVKVTADWQQLSMTITTLSTTRLGSIRLIAQGNTGVATLIMDAWFDDLVLVQNTQHVLVTSFINDNDSTSTSESLTIVEPTLNINVSDSVTVTESITVQRLAQGSFIVSDTITTSESVTVYIDVHYSDSIENITPVPGAIVTGAISDSTENITPVSGSIATGNSDQLDLITGTSGSTATTTGGDSLETL